MDRVHELNLPASLKTMVDGIDIGIKHGEVYPKGNT